MTEVKKHFAFIYNLPEPTQVVLWPAYYEDTQELLENYDEIKEYNISNLGFSAWLSANQPYKVLVKKFQPVEESPTTEDDKPKKVKKK